MSDHPSTVHDSVHNISITAYFGNETLNASIPIKISRNATKEDRMLNTRTFLDFNLTQVDSAVTIYEKG